MASEWENEYGQHPLFQALENLAVALANAGDDEADPEGQMLLVRLGNITAKLKSMLAAGDPLVAPTAPLNSANKQVAAAHTEVGNYTSNGNPQHLRNANSHAEAALVSLAPIPQIRDLADVGDLQEAAVSFRRSMGQYLRHAQDEVEAYATKVRELGASYEELKEEVQQQRRRLDDAIARFQDQFSTAEDSRRQQFQSLVTSLQQQSSDLQDRFQQAQETRSNDFLKLTAELRESVGEFENSLDSRLSEFEKDTTEAAELFQTSLDEKALNTLQALTSRQAEAENIVGAIAQTGMAGGYQRLADREQKLMVRWQVATVVAIVAFVVVIGAFLPDGGASLEWPELTRRILMSLAFGGLAGYAGREAAKHGEKERRYRQLELEIASVGPFLATLDKTRQDVIIEKVADRTFGQSARSLNVEDMPASTNGLIDLLRLVLSELLKKTK